MSSETIEVKKRDVIGSRASRRLRREGRVPAILYGHGEENVNLTVSSAAIARVIQQGTKLLGLTGDVAETVFLRDVQWDAFGVDVLHIDFSRVSSSEKVEVTLPVELVGEAPGSSEGGHLSFTSHELTILCPASSIPDMIRVNIGGLHVGEAVHAGEVELPSGASMVTAEGDVVAQVNKAVVEEEVEEVEELTGAEPEVIGKGKGEEEESGS